MIEDNVLLNGRESSLYYFFAITDDKVYGFWRRKGKYEVNIDSWSCESWLLKDWDSTKSYLYQTPDIFHTPDDSVDDFTINELRKILLRKIFYGWIK